jgi:hypothetical protein
MRTKTLILTAALSIAAAATSMAQAVYSVNVVGYINLNIPTGLNLIANQLNASPANRVDVLFGTPVGALSINKFNKVTGNYDNASFDPDGGWINGEMLLAPGQGAFVDNPGLPITVTFVGEVQKTSTLNITPALDIYSSVLPINGNLTAMSFPTPVAPITVFRFDRLTGNYIPFGFDPDGGWSPSEPTLGVGEAVFMDNTAPAALPWTQVLP